MAKIKHIAVSTQDPEATAKFYVDVFGLKQIGRVDSMGASGYYLTDGDINVAILKFKTDAAAGAERGKAWSGLHHFGFQVESVDATAERLAAAGSKPRDDVNAALQIGHGEKRSGNVEIKYAGPDGIMLDISETGWIGASGFNPS
jgi:glyoxylase I family protein